MSWRRITIIGIGALSVVLCALLIGLRVWSPPSRPFGQLTFSRAYVDKDGQLLRLTAAADGRYRLWTPLTAIAPELIAATIAKEDRRFRYHCGVDALAVARAARGFARGTRGGASTITMQLARLLWRLDTRSLAGKLEQMGRALALESTWSKDEILEAYLNLAPYGGNLEGAGAAAWIYFGKAARHLSRAESLRLALIPQSPAKRGAALGRSGKQAASDRLAAHNLASALLPSDATAASGLARDALALDIRPRKALAWRAPHLVDRLRAALPSPGARVSGTVRTTIDLRLQNLLERQLANHISLLQRVGIKNAAALLVHRPSRAVRAYVGSANFSDAAIDGQVDGVRARRSPGSTLKPLIYAQAIDQGLIHPASLLIDVPSGFGSYDPENFDRAFLGPVDATTALVTSRNIPAIELLNRITADSFENLLRKAGVKFRFPPVGDPLRASATLPGLTMAIGGAEVSMEELAVLYTALGNGGDAAPLRFMSGKPSAAASPVSILSPEAAFIARTMLTDNPRPNERLSSTRRMTALDSPLAIAWKTGTSFGLRDAWAVGLAGEWVLAVWLGDFKGRPNAALVGRDTAGPLLFKIIDALAAERPSETLALFPPAPAKAKTIRVCALSGGLPGPACTATKNTWFIPGRSPVEICPIHRLVEVRLASQLQACGKGGPTIKKAFEFWPTDVLRAFVRLGVPRRLPPALEPHCPVSVAALSAHKTASPGLVILSPRRNLVYPVSVGSGHRVDPILLSARAAPDAGRVFWFLDEALLGDTAPGETLPWIPKPGRYVVRAVDARGSADARDLTVVATR